ncbi:MAG: hypothetical protein H7A23_05065 [Leptospiraceae bacterium]|nr:hypothetical protein [Leptospiraceae bacterium]
MDLGSVIDLNQWGDLWKQFLDSLKENSFPNEEWLHHPNFSQKLDKALEWNMNNPPQISDIEELKQKIDTDE